MYISFAQLFSGAFLLLNNMLFWGYAVTPYRKHPPAIPFHAAPLGVSKARSTWHVQF
jgi:hypothetical protein